jgi:hypothetical protein
MANRGTGWARPIWPITENAVKPSMQIGGKCGMDLGVQLVRDLAAAVPGFADMVDAHEFNYDEVLPHLFFWDATQETVASFLGGNETDWRLTLPFLEDQHQRDVYEVNVVITTSFLLYLPWPGRPGYGLVDHLGRTMRAKFAAVRPAGRLGPVHSIMRRAR